MMGRLAQRFATAIERPTLAYAASLCAVAAAAALRAAIGLVMADPPDYMIFYPAILFATLIAGARGGLLATLASALTVWVLWLEGPQYASLATFVATASATVFIARAIRIAVLRGVAAEERFRVFQEQSLDGFVIVEPIYEGETIIDFTWAYSNDAADRLTPSGVKTLKGARILEIFPGENGRAIVQRLVGAFESGGPDDIEARRLLDGQERFVRSSAMRVTGGLAVTFQDVTAQRQSENALRAGEARIRALLDSLPQLIWSTRPDGACDYLSPQWEAFTGVPAKHHFGEGWLDAVHPEDRDGVQQAWTQAAKGGLPYDIEYRLRRHDGVWRWVNGRATAIHNEVGGVHRWFGTSSDITEIVEARSDLELRVAERTRELEESLLERARTEAALAQAQRLETVGRLTGGVAHDFNNLLTVVIGGLDMILKRPDDTGRVTRLAEAALAAGRRGERLTRQLLAFSRRQELKLEVVDVTALIQQIEPLMRRAVGEAVNLTIRHKTPVGCGRLDPAQFEAALLNLVVNATDAVPDSGGDVEISIERRTVQEGEIAQLVGDYVLVAVSDNGGGMDPDTLERAFEPFFTTKDVGKGTGLGLAQVYGFVNQVGGAVTIDSSIGFGTTVSLYLPAADAEMEAPAAERSHTDDSPWAAGLKVLLVEDDAAVRTVTEGLLSDLGCQVEGVSDGPSALARIQAGDRFDLLISDIVMPGGMSGVDLANAAQARAPDLPIVLTTGYGGERLGDGAETLAWPLLRKPFRAEQLTLALQKALSRSREIA